MKPLRILALLVTTLVCISGPASPASAQETPAPPPAAAALGPEAEQALRARVEQFWSLWVVGQRVKALELVAEDSRDAFLARPVPVVEGFRFDKIVPQASPDVALVYVITERQILHPALKEPIDLAQATIWKQINGQWYLTMNEEAVMETPFGPVRFRPGASSNEQMRKLAEEKAKQIDLQAVEKWAREHDKILIAPPGVEVEYETDKQKSPSAPSGADREKEKRCQTPEDQKSKECQSKKQHKQEPKPAPVPKP